MNWLQKISALPSSSMPVDIHALILSVGQNQTPAQDAFKQITDPQAVNECCQIINTTYNTTPNPLGQRNLEALSRLLNCDKSTPQTFNTQSQNLSTEEPQTGYNTDSMPQ